MNESLTWFGGFEVLVTERSKIHDPDVYGAFVNVTAMAETQREFLKLAFAALEEDGYEVLEVEEVLQIDFDDTGLPEDEVKLLRDCLRPKHPVSYGIFYTYPKDRLDA